MKTSLARPIITKGDNFSLDLSPSADKLFASTNKGVRTFNDKEVEDES